MSKVHEYGGPGELHVLYSAGGRDMQNSSLHDYATTGVRKWSLRKLVNWTQTIRGFMAGVWQTKNLHVWNECRSSIGGSAAQVVVGPAKCWMRPVSWCPALLSLRQSVMVVRKKPNRAGNSRPIENRPSSDNGVVP